ncbi:MAG: efflux RND transporter periplasmic adaptor subunit [Spirochaeta sp.]|jgi:RND family efflux transporter MFP subunit|nr:efflux RND transporter periplasmic adaptor subunit [Spirochaeta sp.]
MKYVRIIGLVSFFAIFAVLGVSCGGESDGASAASAEWNEDNGDAAAPALAVEGLEVSRDSVLQTVESSGIVRGAQEARVVSEVEGMILSAPFELGQPVEEGDVLVNVDATLAALQLEEARGVFESARIDLNAVQRRFENGSASQAELTRARSSANGAQARLQAAENTWEDHTIRAPISGLVAGREASMGRGNYMTRGSAVARIVNLDTVEMEFGVGEQELQYLAEAVPARVNVAACEDEVEATVASIAAGADPRTGSFPVVVRWENTCEGLRSGMSASVRIRVSEENPELIVPDSAIRRSGDSAVVFVARSGSVEARTVVTGRRLGNRVQILDGLTDGEVIVTTALSALSDGAAVEVTVRGRTGDVL